MWPLDFGLIGLGSLVFFIVASQFRFDDPRWLYNAWTYVLIVPSSVVGLSLLARSVASKFVEKSIQLGFLFSVFVHLSLLLLAVNVIIFNRYFPESFTGNDQKRVPVKKTVPDYLFATPSREMTQPDWSKPIDAETASKVEPLEERTLPPVENSAQRLEMPVERIEKPIEAEKFLIPRQTPEAALPTPADAPGKRAKSLAQLNEQLSPSREPQKIETPQERVQPSASNSEPARDLAEPARLNPATSAAMAASSILPTPDLRPQTTPTSGSALAAAEDHVPIIGNVSTSVDRVKAQQRERSITAAGAAPAPMSVAVAALDFNADRMLSPTDLPASRMSRAVGASLTDDSSAETSQVNRPGVSAGSPARSSLASASGIPSVDAGSADQATSRMKIGRPGFPIPAGVASTTSSALAADMAALGQARAGTTNQTNQGEGSPAERIAESTGGSRGDLELERSASQSLESSSSLALNIEMPEGVMGLSSTPAVRSGVSVTTDAEPAIESMSIRPRDRKRVDVGGPMVPAGTEIAAVESFRRRTMRTQGGAAPSPMGVVGPATEEAIERGLAFLASRQESAGNWKLQGHEEKVLLQSDTAATGLCLLSFQGAGYTHQQHQYAPVVARGLQAMLTMQSKDGNLYRSENPVSDQNVAFYSHGIAALALCEAYGMTRDEELREPAQRAINFIVATQHKERGGWRYQPQVSSDTSVSGWMMMALKSGELAGLKVSEDTYKGIDRWLDSAQASPTEADRYRYNPFAANTPAQKHGRDITPTMTAVGMLMRMYSGWRRDNKEMKLAAEYIGKFPPAIGDKDAPLRDTYYWYYATQVMFHMGGEHWEKWNQSLNPILVDNQVKAGPQAGSWDPKLPVPDRWSPHAGRLYLTTMNLLSLEVYYRHLPIYDDVAK